MSVAIVAKGVTGTLRDPNGPPGRSVKKTKRWLSDRYLSMSAGWASK